MHSIKTLTVEICTDWDRFKFRADAILDEAINDAEVYLDNDFYDQVVITELGMIVAVVRRPPYSCPEDMRKADFEQPIEVHRIPVTVSK
jgi:hypothetical protein